LGRRSERGFTPRERWGLREHQWTAGERIAQPPPTRRGFRQACCSPRRAPTRPPHGRGWGLARGHVKGAERNSLPRTSGGKRNGWGSIKRRRIHFTGARGPAHAPRGAKTTERANGGSAGVSVGVRGSRASGRARGVDAGPPQRRVGGASDPPQQMVPKAGLEPAWLAPHAPQTCASTNSATSARLILFSSLTSAGARGSLAHPEPVPPPPVLLATAGSARPPGPCP
jgi:hypothetical protein